MDKAKDGRPRGARVGSRAGKKIEQKKISTSHENSATPPRFAHDGAKIGDI